MKSRLDGLKQPAEISYRSQNKIAGQDAYVSLDDKYETLQVKFLAGIEPLTIRISDIETAKVKDLPKERDGKNAYMLSLCYAKDAQGHGHGAHSSLQFEDRDVRDLWGHGLRSLMIGATGTDDGKQQSVNVPTQQLLPIKSIALQSGESGELMSVAVDLGKRHATFTVPIPQSNVDLEAFKTELWQKVVNFITENSILQTETMSLYRYIRCVVQRALMEKEVTTIIEDINNQNLETLMAKRGERQPGVLDDKQLHQTAEKHLDVLAAELMERVGHHGSGATVVTQILKRNIEKMKLMNNLVLKVADNA
eukprot:GEMP01037129.1.p1 GENE.GEMP01037129.1~~GEMP01037129.1.p1  ORF type:complete len:308 (+),score=72.26 GEMP01037129.1:211-1134(+)